jgi:hypothetical protein
VDMLLRPNVTEVSFRYIESIIIECISSGELGKRSKRDCLPDLIDLLTATLQRAGSGWVTVVAHHVSANIVVATLKNINTLDSDSDRVLQSLSSLIRCFPVIAMCHHQMLTEELIRLIKLNPVVPRGVLSMVAAELFVRFPSHKELEIILTSALSNLAIASTGEDASVCLNLISMLLEYAYSNRQLWNTTLGLAQASRIKFSDDVAVRSLYDIIMRWAVGESSNQNEVSSGPLESSNPPYVKEKDVNMTETPVAKNISDEPSLNVEPGEESPRSSCPSLEF